MAAPKGEALVPDHDILGIVRMSAKSIHAHVAKQTKIKRGSMGSLLPPPIHHYMYASHVFTRLYLAHNNMSMKKLSITSVFPSAPYLTFACLERPRSILCSRTTACSLSSTPGPGAGQVGVAGRGAGFSTFCNRRRGLGGSRPERSRENETKEMATEELM